MRDIAIIAVVAGAVIALGYALTRSGKASAPRLTGTNSADAILTGDRLVASWDPVLLRQDNTGW